MFLYCALSFSALDIEQQLGDYEKQLKMLRVKLEAANNELERKNLHHFHSLILSSSSETNLDSIRNR